MKPIEVALSNDYHVVLAGLAAMLEPYAETVRVVERTTDRAMDAPVDLVLYDTFGRLPGDDEKLEHGLQEVGSHHQVTGRAMGPAERLRAGLVRGLAGGTSDGQRPALLLDSLFAAGGPSPFSSAQITACDRLSTSMRR